MQEHTGETGKRWNTEKLEYLYHEAPSIPVQLKEVLKQVQ